MKITFNHILQSKGKIDLTVNDGWKGGGALKYTLRIAKMEGNKTTTDDGICHLTNCA